MLRIVGFCVGSLLSIALLLLLLGTPDFQRGAGDADEARVDAVIENLQRKWAQQVPAAVEDAVVSTGVPGAAPALGIEPAAHPPEGASAAAVPGDASGPDPLSLALAEANEAQPVPEPDWHAIWSPFRTEIAARGFVERLESVTGLDFRVAKLRSGAYQVAFAYSNPAEVDVRLAEIAAATGLDLSANRP
jgi:hypothetical protein